MTGDRTGITAAIPALFAIGRIASAARLWSRSRELDGLAAGRPRGRSGLFLAAVADPADAEARAAASGAFRQEPSSRIAQLRHLATALVTLGLIGTVIGFMPAPAGIDPSRAGDVEPIPAVVGSLVQGTATALDTTLGGAIASPKPTVDVRLPEGASVRLDTASIEVADQRRQHRCEPAGAGG